MIVTATPPGRDAAYQGFTRDQLLLAVLGAASPILYHYLMQFALIDDIVKSCHTSTRTKWMNSRRSRSCKF